MQGYYNLGKILTDTECQELAKEVKELHNKGELSLETDTRYYHNSYGGFTPGSWDVLKRTTHIIEEATGMKLQPANPYCRIYNNGSTLNKHIDRKGLDWTVSVCLEKNIKHDWPLYVQQGEEIVGFPTIENVFYLMRGGALTHWREPLECSDDEYAIFMFLHWTEV